MAESPQHSAASLPSARTTTRSWSYLAEARASIPIPGAPLSSRLLPRCKIARSLAALIEARASLANMHRGSRSSARACRSRGQIGRRSARASHADRTTRCSRQLVTSAARHHEHSSRSTAPRPDRESRADHTAHSWPHSIGNRISHTVGPRPRTRSAPRCSTRSSRPRIGGHAHHLLPHSGQTQLFRTVPVPGRKNRRSTDRATAPHAMIIPRLSLVPSRFFGFLIIAHRGADQHREFTTGPPPAVRPWRSAARAARPRTNRELEREREHACRPSTRPAARIRDHAAADPRPLALFVPSARSRGSAGTAPQRDSSTAARDRIHCPSSRRHRHRHDQRSTSPNLPPLSRATPGAPTRLAPRWRAREPQHLAA